MGRINLLLVVALFVCVLVPAYGTTWHVAPPPLGNNESPGTEGEPFATIQHGMDAASNGDTVIVAKGTYVENIQFNGKNIVLTSTDPLDPSVVANTIIDGNKAGSVVTFAGTETQACILSGFTIRNGKADGGGGIRGGTSQQRTGAVIQNNVVQGNEAGYGGGLAFCDGPVQDNTIDGNSAEAAGGGLYACDGLIHNNSILHNLAVNGGGLFACDGIIQANIVHGNSASEYGAGFHNCDRKIKNNRIVGNIATWAGGALYDCDGTIENNTISDNSAGDDDDELANCNGKILNCIVWGRAGGRQLRECSVPTYSCIRGWSGAGTANFNSEPYFVDPSNGDFHLETWSPCIDAGDPTSPFSEEPEPNGGRVNIGAYGNTPEATSKSLETDSDGLPDDWELHWFGNLEESGDSDIDGDHIANSSEYCYGWDPAGFAETRVENRTKGEWYQTVERALLLCSNGDELIVSPGLYRENVRLPGKNIVLRSADPSDPDVIAGTLIAGGGKGPVVMFTGTEDETCVLSGFTIQNGTASCGAGICGGRSDLSTHATIENNVIVNNFADFAGGGLAYCDGLVTNTNVLHNQVSGWGGGGFYRCQGMIQGNRVIGNIAYDGGAFYNCNGTILNNVICLNSTSGSGGGLYGCSGTVENNTICGNSARSLGGGLYWCSGSIKNCVIWANWGGGQVASCSVPTYCCIGGWTGEGTGNIVDFPYFVDAAAGDFHFRSWSPCIDSGDPASPFSQEPEPNGGRVNMGAYGNTPEAESKSVDTDADGLPDDWEMEFFDNLDQRGEDDPDGDLLANVDEYRRGLNPMTPPSQWYVDASVPSSGDGRSWETAFKTIQEGINAAPAYDTVIVAPGTYYESIHFKGKNIVLQSTDPGDLTVAARTIVDGNAAAFVVTFGGSEDETCVLSGFTIQHGATEGGGGISGGGTRATIKGNIITRNSAVYGGGLSGCDGIIKNNIITGNSAVYGGGLSDCDGAVQNDTIHGNSATGGGGGGLSNCDGTIVNCIISGNTGGDGPQIRRCVAPTFSCVEDWTGEGQGNTTLDPHFVDPSNGDFHLETWSPCIDAGDPTSPFSEEPEPNGGRVNIGAYGNTPEATSKSLETDSDGLPDDWELHWFGNLNQDGAGDPDEDNILNKTELLYGRNPTSAAEGRVNNVTKGTWHPTIQHAILESDDGDELVVYPAVYEENIRFLGNNIVLRGTAPFDCDVVAKTVLDGRLSTSVVSFLGLENEGCTLSGFTIRDGARAGVQGNGTKAKIQHNRIIANSGPGLFDCDGIIKYNMIADNLESGLQRCDGIVQNNIIIRNSGVYGGGLSSCEGRIENNTIFGNSSGVGGGLYRCTGMIRNCIVWANGGEDQLANCSLPTYCCIEDGRDEANGNIAKFPHFVDPYGDDFHLRSWSPCVDAGDPTSPFAQEPEPNGGRIDIGAYGNTADATSKSSDSDNDELPDEWEMEYFGDLGEANGGDPDNDLISNVLEYQVGSDPVHWSMSWYVDFSVAAAGDGTSWESAFKTIQEAIDAASDGHTVMVAQGTYVEDISFDGKNVVLRSRDPFDASVVASTIIDGSQAGSVVRFGGTEGETCVLAGFTIRNGKATTGGGICGVGILPGRKEVFARATIQNNVISGNSAGSGGGIGGCAGAIRDNIIADNSAVYGYGGGLTSSDGQIENNLIMGNSARWGGGLASCQGQVQNNRILSNVADEGGGLYRCNGTAQNNLVAGNAGGGITQCDATIQNNTISGNSGYSGLYECHGSIRNCLVWGNPGGQVRMSSIPSHSCIQMWTGGGPGNINLDPRFLDSDGPDDNPQTYEDNDYHLRDDSPCMNAGANYYWSRWPQRDLDGNCRLAGHVVDIGCYELGASVDGDGDLLSDADESVTATDPKWEDSDGDGLRDGLEILRGSDPCLYTQPGIIQIPSDLISIQAGLCLAVGGDEVVVSPGTYSQNLAFCGPAVILRTLGPENPDIQASTVLDAAGTGPVVLFQGKETEACVISGFTIRNGGPDSQGGVQGNGTKATIQHNAIMANSVHGLFDCDGLIEHNTIAANLQSGLRGCDGTIESNTITENSQGGITYCSGIIRNNLVASNLAESGGGLGWCDGLIENNTIKANQSSRSGGGLYSCDGTIQSNLILENIAGTDGGGIADSDAIIQNNIVTDNTATSRGGVALVRRQNPEQHAGREHGW